MSCFALSTLNKWWILIHIRARYCVLSHHRNGKPCLKPSHLMFKMEFKSIDSIIAIVLIGTLKYSQKKFVLIWWTQCLWRNTVQSFTIRTYSNSLAKITWYTLAITERFMRFLSSYDSNSFKLYYSFFDSIFLDK